MVNKQYLDLIKKLTEKTQAKQVVWKKSSSSGEFKLQLGTGSLTISKFLGDFNNKPSVYINLYNDQGDQIDVIDIDNEIPEYKIINDLYVLVKRTYYKVDETINGFFNELNTDKIIGKDVPEDDDLPF